MEFNQAQLPEKPGLVMPPTQPQNLLARTRITCRGGWIMHALNGERLGGLGVQVVEAGVTAVVPCRDPSDRTSTAPSPAGDTDSIQALTHFCPHPQVPLDFPYNHNQTKQHEFMPNGLPNFPTGATSRKLLCPNKASALHPTSPRQLG